MADPGLGKAEMMGYFMDQGLFDLVPNTFFGVAGAKDRGAKEGDSVRKDYPLEITLSWSWDSLIETKEEVPFPKAQFF